MSTFGYNFKPWRKAKILADGASIRQYLHEVVDEFHLDRKIHFKHRVISANYDTALKLWIVEIEDQQGQNQTWYANFLLGCTGYYNYDEGFMPEYLDNTSLKVLWCILSIGQKSWTILASESL